MALDHWTRAFTAVLRVFGSDRFDVASRPVALKRGGGTELRPRMGGLGCDVALLGARGWISAGGPVVRLRFVVEGGVGAAEERK